MAVPFPVVVSRWRQVANVGEVVEPKGIVVVTVLRYYRATALLPSLLPFRSEGGEGDVQF